MECLSDGASSIPRYLLLQQWPEGTQLRKSDCVDTPEPWGVGQGIMKTPHFLPSFAINLNCSKNTPGTVT